ncbi:hypothetical protein PHSY_000632 [Pseudozyma hubeiensis SY62]|uniref:Uncharacterized protein n=1 Tax=Pseudozyma hubeiensis (strain SY62) TaxID=1305764 RepID=R9NWZ9_PSEHS|nr:hypothetical protein PHSY_000632 [Pseudozyma hubeiensis SY62]GAC93071.1 hypothetical protein PHSY_000632 [Pseudozyma hubeiensis SY62]
MANCQFAVFNIKIHQASRGYRWSAYMMRADAVILINDDQLAIRCSGTVDVDPVCTVVGPCRVCEPPAAILNKYGHEELFSCRLGKASAEMSEAASSVTVQWKRM